MVVKRSMKVDPPSRLQALIGQGKSILVPMTSSLYVPGTLKNAGKVLVDVGTGYYIEKARSDYSDLLILCSQVVMPSNSTAQRLSFWIKTWTNWRK